MGGLLSKSYQTAQTSIYDWRGRRGRDREFDLQLSVQSVLITTKVVSSNPVHGEVYSIQHYVIKFVSDLRQVGGFLWVPRSPLPLPLSFEEKILIRHTVSF